MKKLRLRDIMYLAQMSQIVHIRSTIPICNLFDTRFMLLTPLCKLHSQFICKKIGSFSGPIKMRFMELRGYKGRSYLGNLLFASSPGLG